jgi:hypothetical protein
VSAYVVIRMQDAGIESTAALVEIADRDGASRE